MIGSNSATASLDGAEALIAVTTSDVTLVNFRALYIGVGGALHILDGQGNDVTPIVGQGFFTCSVTKVFSSGTAASNIFGIK